MFKKLFPVFVIIFVTLLVFRNFAFKGLIPIPGDILIGAYYPWLDYNWGFVTGVPVKNPLPSDVISIIYPSRVLAVEILKQGYIPFWDPTIILGTPLLANFQAAVFNPLNILFAFFSSPVAWGIEVALQPIFIALFTFIYLRNLGLKKFSALFGGLVFAFSGFSVAWMEYNTIGFTLAYFPLILLLVDKIIDKQKAAYSFLFSIAVALQIFSGYPQITIYTLIFSLLYFIARIYTKRSPALSSILLFSAGVGGGILLAAVQLLPSYELLQLSIRSIDKTTTNAGIQFLPFAHVITLFAADFFGNPVTKNFWFPGSYDNFAFSIAPVALFLALLSFIKKVALKKINLVFVLMAIISLMMATDNFLGRFLASNIPGLNSAVSIRVMFIFNFALAVLSAKMLDKIILEKKNLLSVLMSGAIYLGVVLLALLVVKLIIPGGFLIAFRNSVIPAVTVILVSLGILLIKSKEIFVTFIFLLLFFNIISSTDKYLSFIPQHLLYPETEVTQTLKSIIGTHRFDREEKEIFPSNTWTPLGLKAASGQDALYSQQVSKYLSLVNGYYPHLIFRFVDVTGFESPLYNTLDIQYLTVLQRGSRSEPNILGIPNAKFSNPKFKEIKTINTVKILENTQNLGFAWFSKNYICTSDEDKTVEILKDNNFNPRNLAVIDCSSTKFFKDKEIGMVRLIKELPSYQEFKVDTPVENYLIISQAFYPGWEAYIDDQKVTLHKANLALMAVKIPKGEHKLELKYNPVSFTNGVKISVISLLGWVGFLLGSTVLRRYNNTNG